MYYGTITTTSVAASTKLVFTTQYNTNELIQYSNGQASIKAPGYYRIHFDASVAGTGSIVPTLVTDGVASTVGLSTATGTGATDYVSTSFDTVIFVHAASSGYATISVVNSGVAATYANANLIIERLR